MLKNVTDIDLRLLRLFASVVRCGGFTAAQAELNMSQSNISMHIGNLEKRLGYRLCKRGKGGFSYVIGGRSRNVFRYVRDTSTGVSMGLYVQRVDIEPSAAGQELVDPVAVAADLDLVYVADRGAGQVAVFRRRK